MTPQELKNSILQLAIQGKLVEQRPEEGTAEELFARIQQEKQRLIAEKKFKKEKPLPEITDDEKPFDIPENWKWVRLSRIWSILNGDRGKNYPAKSTLSRTGIPFISALNLNGKTVVEDENLLCLSQTQYAKLGNGKLQKNDVVVCIRGSLGKHGVYPFEQWAIASSLVILRNYFSNICNDEFLLLYLDSPLLFSEIKKYDNGTAQPNLAAKSLEQFLFPLPPIAEQKRIVAKIEELLPYIDRYEQAWSKLEQFNSRFPEDMKKSLLQCAIQGKLVEQHPEEGTAEELFAQIQQEKQRLIAEKKIKKEKPLPEITEDEKPFDIPESWKWVRMGDVVDMLSGYAFKSGEFKENGRYRLFRGINLGVDSIRWDDTVYVDEIPEKLSMYKLVSGDVLLGLDRPWISGGIRVGLFDDVQDTFLVQRVLRIRETGGITNKYAAVILRSALFRNAVEGETTGISVPHISPTQVGNTAIPLPPLAEQKRIVKKLEQMLPLCERLK